MNLAAAANPPDSRARPAHWWWVPALVAALVVVLVAGRFFTERLPILPRALNAIDLLIVPVLLPVSLLWVLTHRDGRLRGRWLWVLGGLFVVCWAIAWLVNWSEVHWMGALLFAYGLLAPIAFFLLLINLGLGPEFARLMEKLLTTLLVVNLLIGTVDAALGIAAGGRSADFVFGTFGINQNQLAFFLACMVAYYLARWRYLGARQKDVVLLVWSAILFLLCAFQTMWVIFPVAAGLTLLVAARISRRLIPVVALAVLVPALALSAISFERFSVRDMLASLADNFDNLGKVELVRNVGHLWQSRPSAIVTGVGPGTFNSRAFRNIAIIPIGRGRTDVAAALVTPFYSSEVSTRYILPYFARGQYQLSGSNTDAPFTSYVSVPVEAGVFGAAALFGMYAYVLLSLARTLRRSVDARQKTLAAWAMMSLLMLLGISGVDNFLETGRYTMLVWLIVAVWYLAAPRLPASRQPSAPRAAA